MLESAIAVLAITILFIVLLVFVVPQLWRRVATQNMARRRALNQPLARLDGQLRQAAGQLRPFRELKAQQYSAAYQETREHLDKAHEARRALLALLNAMALPQLPEQGWVYPDFLQRPQYYTSIPRDTVRLRRIAGLLEEAQSEANAAQQAQEGLDTLPEVLAGRGRALRQQRLPELARAVEAEREAGISELSDLEARLERLREWSEALSGRLPPAPNAPLHELDDLAQALEAADEATRKLEGNVAELQAARQALDEERQAVADRLKGMRGRSGQARVPEEVAPLLTLGDALLEEAAAERAQRAFEEARTPLAAARAVAELATAMLHTAPLMERLQGIAATSLQGQPITELRVTWERLLQQAQTLPKAQAEAVAQRAPQLTSNVALVQKRAEEILADHEKDVRRETDAAHKASTNLERSWQALAQLVPLTPEEPLAEDYDNVRHQLEGAQKKPAKLRAYTTSAVQLTSDIDEVVAYLQENFRWADQLLQEMPRALSQGEEVAGPWNCMSGHVAEMREAAMALRDLRQSVARSAQLGQMAELLEAMQRQEEHFQQAEAALYAQRRELDGITSRFHQTLQAVEEQGTDLDEEQAERLLGLARMHHDQAMAAQEFADAREFMEQAYSYARQLALA